ncbi:unnamed protein product [Moneuplotes crassus]|uniref:PCI domain-containing protein n=1 Tax=Euplotes crassus TaxID=5936 RepID=A0AAD1URM9_EUPCR|nr:unnamed protein product [Moneuplotes crassus]
MISSNVVEMLDKLSLDHPAVGSQLEEIKNNYKESMWHIITDQLYNLTCDAEFDQGADLLTFFNDFVIKLDTKINELKYIRIAVNCSRQFQNIEEAITFLSGLEEKVKDSIGAQLFLKVSIAEKRLALGQYNECFDLLEEVEGQLKAQNDIDQIVYSELYKTLALYYRRKEKYTEFYQNGLQFLAYTPAEELTEQEKHEWCINMGKAILLGKDIYNIAELLEKDILKSLINTDYEWLYDILKALNTANIDEFEECLRKYEDKINSSEELVKNQNQLEQKIKILAFLDLIFHREKGDRNLGFELIADITRLRIEDVELLVMKSMSLGLVRGTIDQVDQIIRVSWVKPRMLPRDKIKIMSEKLAKWDVQIKHTLELLTQGSE